jgi:hypothetical protein
VTPGARTRLQLDLDLAADPIAGVVRDAQGNEEPFFGWMAFARTIELSLDAARLASGTGDHEPRTDA